MEKLKGIGIPLLLSFVTKEGRRTGWLRLSQPDASQLLEFALALPFLVVLVVGIADFGEAYNLKQKLNNAAREGARVAASSPTADINCGSCSSTPLSIKALRNTVANYLSNAGISYCTIGTSATYAAADQTWTYALSGSGSGCSGSGLGLTIKRGYSYTSGTATVVASSVTLSFPYTWTFNRVIGLLKSGASPALPTTITSNAIMPNLQ